jgi:hypothetical protein
LQALVYTLWQGQWFSVAVYLDGFSGGVHYQATVLALLDVLLQLLQQVRCQLSIQKI